MRPRFIKNLDDDNHCLQASLLMDFCARGKQISWDQIDAETNYEVGMYTWCVMGVIVLNRYFPRVRLLSSIVHYDTFAKEGENYLKRILSTASFSLLAQHSTAHLIKEQKIAQLAVSNNLIEFKDLTLSTIEKLLPRNFIIALVNAGTLNRSGKNSGHFVFIYNQEKDTFLLHDPGNPPKKRWRINKLDLMEAFGKELIIVPRD